MLKFSICLRSRRRPCWCRSTRRCFKPTRAPPKPATTSPAASISMAIPPSPLDLWAPAGDAHACAAGAALLAGEHFARLYSNGARQGAVRAIDLHVEAIPRHVQVALDQRPPRLRRHRPRRRHRRGRGHSAPLAAAGAQRPHSRHAARPARRGQSAPAGLRCRNAGPHARPATALPTSPQISRPCSPQAAASTPPTASM